MTSMEHTITAADKAGDLTFDELTHYFNPVCMRPNGNTLVLQFGNQISDELVVALRGSASITDALLDANILLVPFLTQAMNKYPAKARVHAFADSWNTVALQITATLAAQRQLHPGHRLVVVGHSMGGALATLAAVSLLQLFPASPVMDQTHTYSYGAPRTGNEVFAAYVNAEFGARAFRVVHTDDGVPTMIPTSLGYHHHGIEYWQHVDPPSPSRTLRCAAGGEDPCCSASVPSGGITPAHATYLGITVPTPFCL
ncbi:alpha/beta-hydrolase [Mycena haematopus]|nr:alpha/beta-hydrolase [Mycena haematopus]